MEYPVELPYKATISQLRLYFNDFNAATNGILHLVQLNDGLSLGYTQLMTATTTGSSGTPSFVDAIGAPVTLDYDNYSYSLLWYQGTVTDGSLQLCGFRIGYTAPNLFGAMLPYIAK